MLSREEVELYRRDGYLPGRRLLLAAETERLRDDCLRTCAEPLRARRSEPVQSEAPRLEPGEAVPVVSLGGRAGAPCQHFGPGGGRNRAGYPGVSHDGLAEAALQRELRPLAPGRDLFWTGTVRAHHRLGGADALAAGERLCPCHPRFPPQWPACPFRRSQRRAHDVVAWAEACRRNPRRGCGGPCPRTRRCVSAPHAYRAQFGHEPERRLADRYRHFDHEAPPQAELDEAALAVHADSQSRYWKAASGIAEMRHIH